MGTLHCVRRMNVLKGRAHLKFVYLFRMHDRFSFRRFGFSLLVWRIESILVIFHLLKRRKESLEAISPFDLVTTIALLLFTKQNKFLVLSRDSPPADVQSRPFVSTNSAYVSRERIIH